jgi:heat shock protein HslJ
MTPRWAALPLALATVTALTACGQAQSPATPGQAAQWPGGRDFLSTSVTENGVDRPLIEDTRISLAFGEDGQLGASAGCNSMGSNGRIEDGVLVLDGLWTTEMACPGGRMAQDAWLADVLGARPLLTLAGDELTLSSPTVTIVLLDREVADPDRLLVGTRWIADTIIEPTAVSSVAHDAPAELVIEPNGAFHATTGCTGGELSGKATVVLDHVVFTVVDERPCTGAGNPLDVAVRSTLQGDRTYEIEAGRLTLMAPDGTGLGLSDQATG